MKRTATKSTLGVILVGSIAAVAAIKADSPTSVPDLDGKTVIVFSGPRLGPTENLKVSAIGERRFIVIPLKEDDGLTREYWTPLDSVESLLVFDDMETAVKYEATFLQTRYRRGAAEQQPKDDAK